MGRNRLEAFSDGVLAILITIMVLELRAPESGDVASLRPLVPTLLGYTLSFVYLGIYWNNHHHLLHAVSRVTGGILLANLHLLFWLSLFPFATAWMSARHADAAPTALYGAVMLLAAAAWLVLQRTIIASQGDASLLARAVGPDRKGKASFAAYALAIACTAFEHRIAWALYVLVALLWLVPDRRIERALEAPAV